MPLALMALVGTLGFNFQVILPLLAKFSFGGGAGAYAALVSSMGVGSIDRRPGQRLARPHRPAADRRRRARLRRRAACWPRRCRRWPLEIPALVALGAAAVTFAASINSSLQLAVAHEMRGRVMALYSVVFLGSTPLGGPLSGWLAETYDPRVALAMAGVAGLSAAWGAHVCFARLRERRAAEEAPAAPPVTGEHALA